MSDPIDIVERLAGMSADHGPDGWPAVQMRDITALCAEITCLRAALAAQVPQWRPIESAPKDGTEFLAFKHMVIGGPCVSVCTWLDSDHPDYDGETPHVAWDHSGFWDATHWMPLPAAPGASPPPAALAVPAGMALAPVEPTRAMLEAFFGHHRFDDSWLKAYRDMLAASPQPPQPQGREGRG